MEAIEAGGPRVVEPDAIFDRDGVQVWPEEGRTVIYDIHGFYEKYGLFQFNTGSM